MLLAPMSVDDKTVLSCVHIWTWPSTIDTFHVHARECEFWFACASTVVSIVLTMLQCSSVGCSFHVTDLPDRQKCIHRIPVFSCHPEPQSYIYSPCTHDQRISTLLSKNMHSFDDYQCIIRDFFHLSLFTSLCRTHVIHRFPSRLIEWCKCISMYFAFFASLSAALAAATAKGRYVLTRSQCNQICITSTLQSTKLWI